MIRIINPKRLIFFLLLLIILLALAGAWAIHNDARILKSGDIMIQSGETARQVWTRAVQGGYTNGVLPWRYYAWREHAQFSLKAGTYHIEKGERISDVIQRLVAGNTNELTITYPEGFTLEQMAARTEAKRIGTQEDFRKAARPANFVDSYTFLKDVPANRTLEGYLFPDTYKIFPDDTPLDVIQRMLTTFDKKFTEDLRQDASAHNRTLDQIVIMASIVEREVTSTEDMATVAGILWKRLDDGVGLNADATIRYIHGNWDQPLTAKDLQIDSPYNTRKYRGLPPGPVSNPGLRAILAAVRPQESDYYYYLSTPDGKTIFSKTLDEHNANKAKYLR